MPRKKPEPQDRTSASRTAALKKRLHEGGGTRMTLNLDGERTRKLDALVEIGVADDRSAVIRRLIDDADYA
jgi:hypothetical protein